MGSAREPHAILDSHHWAELPPDSFHAMQLVDATGPVHEILTFIDAIPVHRKTSTVSVSLAEAAKALSALDEQQRLRAPVTASGTIERAFKALRGLESALQDDEEDLGLEPSEMSSYLSDPPSLTDDLRNAVSTFLSKEMTAYYDRVATFSLVLFTEDMHDGELLASLKEERAEWRRALRPPRRGTADLHLAIIPPPSAVDGVRYLAAELRCDDKLPCVIFLGEKPEFSDPKSTMLASWGARTLTRKPPSYPDQLREVYRTVYSRHAIAPGSPSSALADKVLEKLGGAINPRGALKLLAGAMGGSKLVDVADSVLSED